MIRIIPAIDIIDGKCVRLTQGDYARSKVYNENPLDIAKQFEDCGVIFLHLVDLDGAKAKFPVNQRVLEDIAAHTSLKVEFGGGIKDRDALVSVFSAGACRAVCGSVACTEPDSFSAWLEEFGGERIVLGADLKDGMVAVNGWREKSSESVDDLFDRFSPAGLKAAVVTEISRDGMLSGPDVELYGRLMARYPDLQIVASGGVGSVGDVEQLDRAGVPAVIVGKAIYEGRISLAEIRNMSGSTL